MAGCAAPPRAIEPGSADSAQAAAMQVLRHLADGDLEAAAALSNAPRHRLELLRTYQSAIGEEAFKRRFAQYLDPRNRLLAEVALGPRRLLVWELGEAGKQVAGQFYIQVDGRFLMDDVVSPGRDELRRILNDYRKKSGSEPDFP